MMQTWGVPSILLHSKAYEYAKILADKGERVVDLAFADGFALEDHIVKAMALGSPFVKLICMGRATMTPGFLGTNIEGVINPSRREKIHGNWDKLPPSVTAVGVYPEEIFAGYFDVKKLVGEEDIYKIPYGAIAFWTLPDKLAGGAQQLLAELRKFDIHSLSRSDISSGNRETERETGIPFITSVQDEEAKNILLTF